MKKILNCFLGSVMLIGLLFPTTVSAAEDGDSVYTDNLAEYSEDEFSSEVQEDNKKIMFHDMLQEEGDVQVLGTRDGEVYCVELVDVTVLSDAQYGLRDGVESRTFLYTKTNALGVKTKLMSVNATLTWLKNQKITSFTCTHEIYNNLNIIASWVPGYVTQNDLIWIRELDVIWENGDSEILFFSGSLMTVDGKDTVDIDSSTSLYQ